MNSKNHFIFGYKRFVSYLGRHPKTLRSDQGTEILNKELTAYLETNHTNHIVCSKDEHASIGAAENSIGVLRTSAKAMMLAGNFPKRYRQFVTSHAAYLNNIVAPSCCDRTKTIFEILFGRCADVRRIPPIGAFCAVYSDRRQLQDQSFGLTSKQGVCIGIARYKKVLGCVVTDVKSLFVTRDHITFDPQLFPFKIKPTSSTDWQTFYNLTNPVAEGAVLHKSPSATPENPMPDYVSDESDLDPDFDSSQNPESADINDILPTNHRPTTIRPIMTQHLSTLRRSLLQICLGPLAIVSLFNATKPFILLDLLAHRRPPRSCGTPILHTEAG
jgi:hypothetical protein